MHIAALRDVLTCEGPFASIYFDATHDTEDAAKELQLRWRAVRDRLAELEAPQRMLAALDEAVRTRHPATGRAGRFLVAAEGAVLIDEYLPMPPPRPEVRLSALPYLLPLAANAESVPYVVVQVNKTGAELRAVDADGTVLDQHTVEGRDHPVHKVGEGGWSHRNIQRHVEETVKHNITDVAAETERLVRHVGAHLLVLAGDVEPRTMLRKAIPESCARIAVEVDTGWPLEHDIDSLVAEQVRTEQDEVLERFQAELGRSGGLAVQGLRPTAEALREANVAALVVGNIDDTTVWTGQQPQLVAVEPGELDAIGAENKLRGRADEVLPAAAIAVGAEVLAGIEELELTDGVGALLRHG